MNATAINLNLTELLKSCAGTSTAAEHKLVHENFGSFMNAHFIYGSLTSIQHFILKNKKQESVNFLSSFSRLIRFVLDHQQDEEIKLSTELEFIEKYVSLENTGFDLKIDFQLNIDPAVDVENILLPPMLLQPYIENAIRHGLLQKDDDRKLSVSIDKVKDKILIQIDDNGIGIDTTLASKKDQLTRSGSTQVNWERMQRRKLDKNKSFCIQSKDKSTMGDETGTLVSILLGIPENNFELSSKKLNLQNK